MSLCLIACTPGEAFKRVFEETCEGWTRAPMHRKSSQTIRKNDSTRKCFPKLYYCRLAFLGKTKARWANDCFTCPKIIPLRLFSSYWTKWPLPLGAFLGIPGTEPRDVTKFNLMSFWMGGCFITNSHNSIDWDNFTLNLPSRERENISHLSRGL